MGIGSFFSNLFGGGQSTDSVLFEIVETDMAQIALTTDHSGVTALDTAFAVSWGPADDTSGLPAKSASRRLVLAVPPEKRGRKVLVTLEGYQQYRARPGAQMTIAIDGRRHRVDLSRADAGFEFSKKVRLAGAATLAIAVEILVPRPGTAGQFPEVAFHSIDLTGRSDFARPGRPIKE